MICFCQFTLVLTIFSIVVNSHQILGRFILGFSGAEIVHRQFIVCFLPASLIVAESARLVQFQASGQVFGLFVGSLMELCVAQVEPAHVGPIRAVNWFMMCLWTIHMLLIVAAVGKQQGAPDKAESDYNALDAFEGDDKEAGEERDSSDSSHSDRETGPVSRLLQRSSQLRDSSAAENDAEVDIPLVLSEMPRRKTSETLNKNARRVGLRRLTIFAKRIRRLLAFNVSIPISLSLIVYSVFAQEMFFSSCALITDRYFQWRGNAAGFFLGSLSVIVLPTDFFCEKITRRYEERTIVKASSQMSTSNCYGLIASFCPSNICVLYPLFCSAECAFVGVGASCHGQLGLVVCINSQHSHPP
jgi:hypothetical protein